MALSKKIGITIDVAADRAQRDVDKFKGSLDKTKQSSTGVVEALGSVKAGILAAAAAFAAGAVAVDRMSARIIRYQGVMNNAAFSIDRARTATKGLISDFELQRLANQAALLKVAQTDKEFAQLAGAARKLGLSIGQGPVQSIESMLAALGRGSTEMLDNLGIVLKVEQAQEEYARSLGKLRKELTATEKAEAFRVVATQKILEASEKITDETNKSAESIQRMRVQIDNATDSMLEFAADKFLDAQRAWQREFSRNIESGIEFTTAITDADRATAQLLIDTKNTAREAQRLAQIWDPMALAIQRVADEAQELGRAQSVVADLLQQQSDLQRKSSKQIEIDRRRRQAGARRAHQERLRQIEEERRERERLFGPGEGQFVGGTLTPDEAEQARGEVSSAQLTRAFQEEQAAREKRAREETLEAQRVSAREFDRLHQQELDRVRAEAAAVEAAEEAKRQAFRQTQREQRETLNASQSIMQNNVATAQIAADGLIKSEQRREKAKKAIAGSEAIGIGILQQVKAVAAFASFNFVQGAAHQAAAIFAFARGGQLLAQAGSAGGGGGASVPGAITGSQFGNGGVETGGSTQSSSGGSSRPDSDGPISEVDEESVQRSGRGGRRGRRRRNESSAGPTIQVFHVGQIDDETGIKLNQALRRADRKAGRMTT